MNNLRKFSDIKRKKKITTSVTLGEDIHDMLFELYERRHDATRSQIVADAIRFATKMGMYTDEYPHYLSDFGINAKVPVRATTKVTTPKAKQLTPKQELKSTKRDLAAKYGCDIGEDGFCSYTVYEQTPTGVVVKLDRGQMIEAMPDSEEGWKQLLFGGFTTQAQAEAAFKKSKSPQVKERTITTPKKKAS